MHHLNKTTLALLVLAPLTASAQTQLVGVEFRDGGFAENARLFDIDPATGAATNPRFTGADVVSDIAQGPDGLLYAFNDDFGVVNGLPAGSNLFTINPVAAETTVIGDTGLSLNEGGLEFDASGTLYGVTSQNGASSLFTIDTTTGVGTTVGAFAQNGMPVELTDASAMAFDDAGTLYVLDTTSVFPSVQSFLYTLDPATANITSVVELDRALGTTAGLAFESDTGELLLADGDFNGTNELFSVDLTTGVLALRGTTVPGTFGGLSGLEFAVVPEPAAGLALFGTTGVLLRRRGR
jgi:hypothetical protein